MIPANMIYMGDTPHFQISSAPNKGNISSNRFKWSEWAADRQGTTIRATTAGRIPLKIFITQTLS